MGRGKTGVPGIVRGAHAWAYMRRDPDYCAAWAAQAQWHSLNEFFPFT